MLTYAQNFEDVILQRALYDVKRGVYVDVGANDPIVDSVTRAFYDQGWRGINIEPVETYWRALRADRPEDVNLHVVVADHAGSYPFYEIEGTGLSTTNRELAAKSCSDHGFSMHPSVMPHQTLTQIFDKHKISQIHFLKIDVEGSEHSVLKGLDLKRYRPWVILIEATEQLTQKENYHEWEPLLLESGYRLCYRDGLNRFYLADERQDLAPRFEYPPNVFDQIVPFRLVELHDFLCRNQSSRKRTQPSNSHEYFLQIKDLVALQADAYESLTAEHARQSSLLKSQIANLEKEVAETRHLVSKLEHRLEAYQSQGEICKPRRSIATKIKREIGRFLRKSGLKLRVSNALPTSIRRKLKKLEQKFRRFRRRRQAYRDGSVVTMPPRPVSKRARTIHKDLERQIKKIAA